MTHGLSFGTVLMLFLCMSRMPRPQALALGLIMNTFLPLFSSADRRQLLYSAGRIHPPGTMSNELEGTPRFWLAGEDNVRFARPMHLISLSLRPMHQLPGKWFTFWNLFKASKPAVVGCFAQLQFHCTPLIFLRKPALMNAFCAKRIEWNNNMLV